MCGCNRLHQPKTEAHKRKIRASCRAHAARVKRALQLLEEFERQQQASSCQPTL